MTQIEIVAGQYDKVNKVAHLTAEMKIPDGEVVVVIPLRYVDALCLQYLRRREAAQIIPSDLEAEVDL